MPASSQRNCLQETQSFLKIEQGGETCRLAFSSIVGSQTWLNLPHQFPMEQRRNFPEQKQGAPAISPIQLSENQRELLHTELFQLAGPLDSILTGGQSKIETGQVPRC